jgi:UDP-N-acetyl-2-amino-2-deoxyglucuronate dehydrogenase
MEFMRTVKKGKKIKVALVGCGRISKKHFEAINEYAKYMKLVAICDTAQEVLEKYSAKFSVEGYSSLSSMLKCVELDLVVICTPSGLHPEQTIMAANQGVHIMTEKPMATRWKDGLKMVRACDYAGVRLFVVKQNRKNSTLQLLKRAITEKRFGKINMVNINVFWTRPQEYYDKANWRGTWEYDGGAFMNQASHYVDLLDWLVGPIDKVQAMMSTTRNIEVEDTGVLNIKWRNGTLGSMNVTMLTYPKNFEGSITILGDKGTVRIGGVSVNDIEHWEFDDFCNYDKQVEEVSYKTTSVYGFGHSLYYKNVINSMYGQEDPEIDGREGLKSLEILIAAYLSARDVRTVSLPLEY